MSIFLQIQNNTAEHKVGLGPNYENGPVQHNKMVSTEFCGKPYRKFLCESLHYVVL